MARSNEAWIQKRDLPFVIIAPQLDKFSRGQIPYIRDRTPAQIPKRLAEGTAKREDERAVRTGPTLGGLPAKQLARERAQRPARGLERDGWRGHGHGRQHAA